MCPFFFKSSRTLTMSTRSYSSWESNSWGSNLKWIACGFDSRKRRPKSKAVIAKCTQDTLLEQRVCPVLVSYGIRVILNIAWKIAAESRGNLICTWMRIDVASCRNADRSHSNLRDECSHLQFTFRLSNASFMHTCVQLSTIVKKNYNLSLFYMGRISIFASPILE